MSTSNQSRQQPPKKNRLGAFLGGIPTWVGLLAAIVSALGAVGFSVWQSNSPSRSGADPSVTITPRVTITRTVTVTPAVSQTSSTISVSTPEPSVTAVKGTAWGKGYSFQLGNGFIAPLGIVKPTPDQVKPLSSGGPCNISYNGELNACDSEKIIILPTGSTPTYSACSTSTLPVTSASTSQGTSFCVIEGSGHIAGVIVEVSSNSPIANVILKVNLWE